MIRVPPAWLLDVLADALAAELGKPVAVRDLLQNLGVYECRDPRCPERYAPLGFPTPHSHLPDRLPRRWISADETARIVASFGRRCLYCRQVGTYSRGPDGDPWVADHYVPKARGGSCEPVNLVLACRTCNDEKCDKLWLPGRRLIVPPRLGDRR